MPLEPLADKWRAFGLAGACGGRPRHRRAFWTRLHRSGDARGAPNVIIAETVKGCGVSFMAGKREWHGHPICDAEFQQAMWNWEEACECTE